MPFVEIPAVSTVHCPIGFLVETEYRALHDLPTETVGVPFYSGVWARSYRADRKSARDAITAQAGSMIDFPAVIEQAYRDGIRVFLEMGPGSSCSRMIGQILGNRPHLACSACVPDRDPVATVLSLLAEAYVWGVPVNLEPLYGEQTSRSTGSSETQSNSIRRQAGDIRIQAKRLPFPQVKKPASLSRSTLTKPESTTISEKPNLPSPAVVEIQESPRVAPPMPNHFESCDPNLDVEPLARQVLRTQAAVTSAHEAYLKVANDLLAQIGEQITQQLSVMGNEPNASVAAVKLSKPSGASDFEESPVAHNSQRQRHHDPVALDREQCLEFAVGSIARVLGPEFAPIDSHPTRVRLPDEPLMLVDRIMTIEGTPRKLGEGRVVTEHDVLEDGWYLDANRIAPSISIESGQADLFLSGYLGIDFETKGLAVYRLLDATVTFHRGLPGPGNVIRYDIKITQFFRQGETHLFRFEFDATVNGEPLLTMRDGCAGFFSPGELAAGKGIVPRPLDSRPRRGIRPDDWVDLVPPTLTKLDHAQLESLRRGDFTSAFGASFRRLQDLDCLGLPGGRMSLVDRVETLETLGGRFGLGLIRAEADIHPGDWFMVCHFVDDRVMPGTLMYEGCLHTLRLFLMSLGWVGDRSKVAYEPVPGVASRLRCRGQVIESTRKVAYEVTIKELGFRPEPYAIADALMYADGRPIVEIADMSLQLTGATRDELTRLWNRSGSSSRRSVLFDQDRLLEFATGKPSAAFGEAYRPFDEDRFIARLPRPPYQFLSRIVSATAQPWVLEAGGTAEAEYDVPEDAWYFDADRQGRMPFAVLLEVPLQACGWMAAYMGSALRSSEPLKFRNLGGSACQHAPVTRHSGTLRISTKCTKVSSSAGMILQHYEFSVRDRDTLVYDGTTYFGFFHPNSLEQQVGIRETTLNEIGEVERSKATSIEIPHSAPFPDFRWRMIDRVTALIVDGGPSKLGLIEGTTSVDPDAWFFDAHFLGDPVWPGSLGLESLLQLLKVLAWTRWGAGADAEFEAVTPGIPHHWEYRGQVVPRNRAVTVQAVITARDDNRRLLRADGLLSVDGKVIYQMKDFTLRVI
jgi:3-hydroxymyristoyl/3-hydroxydecanoyl-(acyl carrier protein) dehydratase